MSNTFNYLILILSLFVTLGGCSDSPKTPEEITINVSELLQNKFTNSELLVYENDTLLANLEVLSYYKSTNFSPIWTTDKDLTPNGNEFLNLIENAYDYGFIPEMFHSNLIHKMKDSSLLDTEMLLTNAFFLYTTHINKGCVDTLNYKYVWKKDSLNFSLEEELNRVKNGDLVTEVITSHQPIFWDYLQLQKGLVSFLDSFNLDTIHFEIPPIKEDSAACYAMANKALIGHYFLDSVAANDDTLFLDRLKAFQIINGLNDDAVVGRWTGRMLAKSNMDRFYQAALSLEKWRWKNQYPNRYIRVNIPEYSLVFVDSNSVKRKHRVVVGAYATQTPEFQATMRRLVTNPFWHVPYSISSTEILSAAKNDSSYFDKRTYKIFKGGEQVDPNTVNWSTIKETNFPYRVRQDGGNRNSLGKVKFLFPNGHSVFIHDTPSKRLFANDVRAYSHGCVRLHKPFDLAKSIISLDQQKLSSDSLDAVVSRGEQRVIELNEPFEVYIEYFTATGDSAGNIRFYPDIYGRDDKYITNSFKKF